MRIEAKQRMAAYTYATYYAEQIAGGAFPIKSQQKEGMYTITVAPLDTVPTLEGNYRFAEVNVSWPHGDKEQKISVLTGRAL